MQCLELQKIYWFSTGIDESGLHYYTMDTFLHMFNIWNNITAALWSNTYDTIMYNKSFGALDWWIFYLSETAVIACESFVVFLLVVSLSVSTNLLDLIA